MKETRSQQERLNVAMLLVALRTVVRQPVGQLSVQLAHYLRTLQDRALVRRLAAHLPQRAAQRLGAALAALWLLEAFLVCNIFLAFIAWLSSPPSVFGAPQGPSTASLFVAIVVVPGFILAARWKRGQAMETEVEQESVRQTPDLERACRLLYVHPDAPLYIAQAAYAAAMKKHHPDVAGGDNTQARELNWAIETFREHRDAAP
jgi:hypothetical protein